MIQEYTKQAKYNAIARYPLTNAQPIHEQQTLPPSHLPPVLLFSVMSYGMEYPFGQFGSAVLAVSPPSFLCIPSLLTYRAV